jgi:hypothetical protein
MWLLGEIKYPNQPFMDLTSIWKPSLVFGHHPKNGYAKHQVGIKNNLTHSQVWNLGKEISMK